MNYNKLLKLANKFSLGAMPSQPKGETNVLYINGKGNEFKLTVYKGTIKEWEWDIKTSEMTDVTYMILSRKVADQLLDRNTFVASPKELKSNFWFKLFNKLMRIYWIDKVATMKDAGLTWYSKDDYKTKMDSKITISDDDLDYAIGKELSTVKTTPAKTGLDFSRQDLEDRDFTGQDLSGANFKNSILVGSSFVNAILRNADFTGAEITDAAFTLADLTGATLEKVSGRGAIFKDSTLNNVKGSHIIFNDANFAGATIHYGNFSYSNFKRANFGGADLTNTSFYDCSLSEADFDDANLTRANLSDSILNKAKLDPKDDLQKIRWKADMNGYLQRMP